MTQFEQLLTHLEITVLNRDAVENRISELGTPVKKSEEYFILKSLKREMDFFAKESKALVATLKKLHAPGSDIHEAVMNAGETGRVVWDDEDVDTNSDQNDEHYITMEQIVLAADAFNHSDQNDDYGPSDEHSVDMKRIIQASYEIQESLTSAPLQDVSLDETPKDDATTSMGSVKAGDTAVDEKHNATEAVEAHNSFEAVGDEAEEIEDEIMRTVVVEPIIADISQFVEDLKVTPADSTVEDKRN
jgi:hypothetical protein